jgi:RNA polymerase sigma factor (sigma-70 family)
VQDAVHDALIVLLDRLNGGLRPENLRAFAARIVCCKARDIRRRNTRRPATNTAFEITSRDDSVSLLVALDLLAAAGLNETYREVAALIGLEGLTVTDVASILGVHPETVRRRLRRLAAALRAVVLE